LRFRGRVADHGAFVLHHAAGKLQSFMQLTPFRRHQRSRQKLTRHLGRGRLLKILYEMMGRLKTGLPFGFLSDVCRLKGEINASGGAVGLIRRHDLFAKHKARLSGQFDTCSGAKSEGSAVYNHHFASAKIENKTHVTSSCDSSAQFWPYREDICSKLTMYEGGFFLPPDEADALLDWCEKPKSNRRR
jgi:hypothetical protein